MKVITPQTLNIGNTWYLPRSKRTHETPTYAGPALYAAINNCLNAVAVDLYNPPPNRISSKHIGKLVSLRRVALSRGKLAASVLHKHRNSLERLMMASTELWVLNKPPHQSKLKTLMLQLGSPHQFTTLAAYRKHCKTLKLCLEKMSHLEHLSVKLDNEENPSVLLKNLRSESLISLDLYTARTVDTKKIGSGMCEW